MIQTNKILSMILVSLLLITCNKEDETKKNLMNLSGKYSDAKPYNYGKAWGKREFSFENGKWTLFFTLALDPEMKLPVFTFRTLGTFKIEEKSSSVKQAYNALFMEEKKFVTLKTNDKNLIQAFRFAECDLEKDVEKDISEKGCSAWKSVSECPGDYDLLSLDNEGKLYFGERPQDNNMCSPDKRPTKLTPPVSKL
ncbi:MAG: hypothetical protein SFU98_16870 [Leptospiraceae bacterium]|nr:hypothetical protein [Leptospiraceae bacterium]